MSAYSAAILAEAGLFAYYHLDDAATGASHPVDSSPGSPHTGNAILGAPTLQVPGLITGDANTAMRFNTNSSDYIRYVADGGGYLLGGRPSLTIECWIKGTTTGGAVLSTYAEYDSTAANALFTQTVTNAHSQLTFLWKGQVSGVNNSLQSASGLTLADGNPHHLVLTKNVTALQWYVDGAASGPGGSTNGDDTFGASNSRVRTGNWFDSSSFGLAGFTLDEMALYTVALSPAQVLNHWQIGNGIVAGSQLVAHPIGRLNR